MVKNEIFFDVDKNLSNLHNEIISEINSNKIGYYHLPEQNLNFINELNNFLKGKNFTSVVLIGIGGSNLGVKAVTSLLEDKIKIKFYFLDNVDSFSFNKVIKSISFKDTLFIISSKSGTTIETITLLKCVIDAFKIEKFDKNFIVLSDKDSSLKKFAIENSIKNFEIPTNVGGRFSVLSAIGIVPFAIANLDIKNLLKGAKDLRDEFISNSKHNILKKAFHFINSKNIKINVLFSYCDRFKEFNAWYVQLLAESLGKISKDNIKVGITPIGLIGSIDQHSFLQLIIQGENNKSVTFIKVLDNLYRYKIPDISLNHLKKCDFVNNLDINEMLNFQCDATLKAIVSENVDCDLITIDKIDEYNIGYLIMYFEILTSCMGKLLNINTYDQPGVEIGKEILKKIVIK